MMGNLSVVTLYLLYAILIFVLILTIFILLISYKLSRKLKLKLWILDLALMLIGLSYLRISLYLSKVRIDILFDAQIFLSIGIFLFLIYWEYKKLKTLQSDEK